jgi:hypothetical protein
MRLAFAVFALLFALIAAAGDIDRATRRLPQLGPPPHGEAQWIARSMRFNGLPMTVQSFRSPLAPEEVLRHYEELVRRSGNVDSMRSWQGQWQVLSLLSGEHYITIQAQRVHGVTLGTITTSVNPARVAPRMVTQFPVPRGPRLVAVQEYEDAGIEAEQIQLESVRAPHVEAAAFRHALLRDGWHLAREQPTRQTRGGHLLEAQRGAEHALLTFVPDRAGSGKTLIVIVWRRS